MSNKGRVVSIPKISNAQCVASLNRWYPEMFLDGFQNQTPVDLACKDSFCAGFVNKGINSDACYGDEGTAFLCPKNGYFTLEGVLSGWDCSSTPGSPSMFTDVCASNNLNFIQNNI